jgi:hypothetical protein
MAGQETRRSSNNAALEDSPEKIRRRQSQPPSSVFKVCLLSADCTVQTTDVCACSRVGVVTRPIKKLFQTIDLSENVTPNITTGKTD